jgi:hypothetical protein
VCRLEPVQADVVMEEIQHAVEASLHLVERSALPGEYQERYQQALVERLRKPLQ